ncbi:hypothetical protein MPSI1_001484 [Malassezia psittaci]|uniref:Post-GPI attachment to proteins factor 3 n=1 Tax=Malassezia psittaci TaxID=1821823 RepID=A0AAF0F9K6_9BASI|nr:hypothetical protein MPSI1_001484 [Malassezia psittaci]
MGAIQEQESLKADHERWRKQIAWQEAGQGLDPACEGEAFSDIDGQCISLMRSPPKPLQSENVLRQEAEKRIQQELDWLPLIDKQTVQFFGKWAQLRVLGMQEPFSVLFSILNLGVHIYALSYILPELVPNGYPLKPTYTRHAKISIVAWASSALFHTRDLWWTERLDYFMAAAVLLSGLFFTVCRLTYASPTMTFYQRWSIVCIVAWVLHVLYLLSHRRLNYSYNITACLTVGLLHNFLWFSAACTPRLVFGLARQFSANFAPSRAYSKATDDDHDIDRTKTFRSYTDLSGKQRKQLICLVLLMTLAPALEIFDFPPILRLVDAHALWHASTVPISLYWYIWLANDAQLCVLERGWKLDHHAIELKETNHGHASAHHTGLPPPGVSPAKTTSFSFPTMPATSSASTDEIIGQLRNGLHVYANMGMNALRRLRALLITQS